jgi:hypothetical protein
MKGKLQELESKLDNAIKNEKERNNREDFIKSEAQMAGLIGAVKWALHYGFFIGIIGAILSIWWPTIGALIIIGGIVFGGWFGYTMEYDEKESKLRK